MGLMALQAAVQRQAAQDAADGSEDRVDDHAPLVQVAFLYVHVV